MKKTKMLIKKFLFTHLQKKPKIMGKEHCMSEISKHSTSTEAMFFDKVVLEFSMSKLFTCVCVWGFSPEVVMKNSSCRCARPCGARRPMTTSCGAFTFSTRK